MLTRWNDFAPLSRFAARDFSAPDSFDALRREMNRLFYDFETGLPGAPFDDAAVWPRASLDDNGNALVFRAEVPGLNERDIELNIDGATLSLKGERKDTAPEGYSVHRKERRAYRFARSFSLPTKIDPDAVEATLKNGVLTVTLPKAKEAQPRQISVRTAS